MSNLKKRCKYCGTPTRTSAMCGTCTVKLRLIRKIQNMLRAEKRREEERARVRHTTN